LDDLLQNQKNEGAARTSLALAETTVAIVLALFTHSKATRNFFVVIPLKALQAKLAILIAFAI
jgi:hypothetical protein